MRSRAQWLAVAAFLLVTSSASTSAANDVWVAPTLGFSDITDGQSADFVMGLYAGWEAPTGFVQVGTEALRMFAEEVEDPIARAFDLRAARLIGPVGLGLHFDFILLGNRDRRGEVGPELSIRFDALDGAHDISAVYGVGRGSTFAETTQYVQLAYFGYWEVEDGRGIFAKLHTSYHAWRWDTLGAPMVEGSLGLRF